MGEEHDSGRLTAEERRSEIIEAAIQEFAINGLAGASTTAISERAGISQPYLFKLFGTKRKLFIAAYDRVAARIDETMRAAADAHPEDPVRAMDEAYVQLLGQRSDQMMILQAYAAGGDDEVREYVRANERRLFADIVRYFDGDVRAARIWWAEGLLEAVGVVLDIPEFLE